MSLFRILYDWFIISRLFSYKNLFCITLRLNWKKIFVGIMYRSFVGMLLSTVSGLIRFLILLWLSFKHTQTGQVGNVIANKNTERLEYEKMVVSEAVLTTWCRHLWFSFNKTSVYLVFQIISYFSSSIKHLSKIIRNPLQLSGCGRYSIWNGILTYFGCSAEMSALKNLQIFPCKKLTKGVRHGSIVLVVQHWLQNTAPP